MEKAHGHKSQEVAAPDIDDGHLHPQNNNQRLAACAETAKCLSTIVVALGSGSMHCRSFCESHLLR